jgi:hypothetical protein
MEKIMSLQRQQELKKLKEEEILKQLVNSYLTL